VSIQIFNGRELQRLVVLSCSGCISKDVVGFERVVTIIADICVLEQIS